VQDDDALEADFVKACVRPGFVIRREPEGAQLVAQYVLVVEKLPREIPLLTDPRFWMSDTVSEFFSSPRLMQEIA